MSNKDTQSELHIMVGGESGLQQQSTLKFTAPKGSIWAVLVVRPDGRMMFSIETEGGNESQLKTLYDGTLLAHTEVMNRCRDNGRPSINDVIPPEWRAVVTEAAGEPVKT